MTRKEFEIRRQKRKEQKRKKTTYTMVAAIILAILVVFVAESAKSKSKADAEGIFTEGDLIVVEAEQEIEQEQVQYEKLYTDRDVELIAKTVYGEARNQPDTQMSAVVWCILNRVDSYGFGCGEGIEYVVTKPHQFVGYKARNPVTEHIEWLVRDVLDRWCAEKAGMIDVGRTLPKDYLYFSGNGKKNTFRNNFNRKKAKIWDWSYDSPYEN